MRRIRALAALALWCAGLVAVGAALLAAGRAAPLPAGFHRAAVERWLGRPGSAAISLVRVVALAVDGWLLVATALRLLAAAARVRIGVPWTPRLVQRLVATAVGTALSLGPVAAGATTAASTAARVLGGAGSGPPPAVLVLTTATSDASAPAPATLVLVPTVTPTVPPSPTDPPSGSAPAVLVLRPQEVADPPAAADPATAASSVSGEFTVRPGDSFWSITDDLLSARLGRAPSDAEVVPVWRAFIAANRDRVRDPNLVFPGQALRLPPDLRPPT